MNGGNVKALNGKKYVKNRQITYVVIFRGKKIVFEEGSIFNIVIAFYNYLMYVFYLVIRNTQIKKGKY